MVSKNKCRRETKNNKVTKDGTRSKNCVMINSHEKNFRREDHLKEGHVIDQWS